MSKYKDELMTWLSNYKESSVITPGCRKLLSNTLKRVKTADHDSLFQFIEIVAMFYDNFITCEMRESLKNSENQNSDDGVVISEDGELQEFEKFITELAKQANNYENHQNENNKITKDIYEKVKWIKRPMMVMNITETRISVNKSFTEYLKDVHDSLIDIKHKHQLQPYVQYSEFPHDEFDDDEIFIDCVIGTDTDFNILLTIMSGVSDLHKFKMYIEDDVGYFKKDDVKLFHTRTGHKHFGKYVFQIDDKLRSLVGRKIYPIINKEETE